MSKFPILFESNESEFKTHGIGVLSDAVQCDVTEELNGIFELTMVYPFSGIYLRELQKNRIIYTDASKELGEQPFRIVRITKLLNGFVNVYAQHISYDLGGIQLPPFETLGTNDGLTKIQKYSTTQNDFSFSTTVIVDETDEDNAFSIETPKSVRAYLLGEKDSFLQAYGGEFTFDRFDVRHATLRGSDKGFRIKYGVNMVDLNQEESIESTYTGIYPYYKDEYQFTDMTETYDLMYPREVDTSKLAGKIMYADGTFYHTKIANIDLSSYMEFAPLSTTEVEEAAKKYMEENNIGIPRVSLDVKYESLRNSPEYSNVAFLEDVYLGDTIHVDFAKLGVSSKGRVNTIIYDSLRHKNKRISVGDPKSNVADTLVTISNGVKQSQTQINASTKTIAKLTVETAANSAGITAVAERMTDAETNIGYLEIDVAEHTTTLEAIAKWQDDTDASIASIEVETAENSAKVELLVKTSESGENAVRGEILVEAINGQSEATIQADKVNLTGYVTVNSLQEDGTTVIDGSRIQTGQIVSKNYSDSYLLLISYAFEALEASTYSFRLESGGNYYNFTTTKEIPYGGSVRFYQDSQTVETFDASQALLETLSTTVSSYPTNKLDLDISVWFSESGTKIDLESGEIIAPQFAMKNDGSAYFGGKLNVTSGALGPFMISGIGLYTQYPVASLDNGAYIGLYMGGFDFHSDRTYLKEEYVSVNIGDAAPVAYGGNPEKIEMKNSNGDLLRIVPSSAQLSGAWKATPYSDTTSDVSEIVTKQDLINLGLITA